MLFSSWLRNWKRSGPAARRRTQRSSRYAARVEIESLESRCVPSTLQFTPDGGVATPA